MGSSLTKKPKPLTPAQQTKKIEKLAISFGLLSKTDILSFGKYNGKKVSVILKNDPDYVLWVQNNTKYKFIPSIIKEARSLSDKLHPVTDDDYVDEECLFLDFEYH